MYQQKELEQEEFKEFLSTDVRPRYRKNRKKAHAFRHGDELRGKVKIFLQFL